MPVSSEVRAHRLAVARRCDRLLSGARPASMAEQLDLLRAAPIDLDVVGDRYGDGPVTMLEERVAALLGKPAAVFFPTGTMAQQVILRIWASRAGNAAVALHPLAHPEAHERHAYTTLSGLRQVFPTTEPRQPTAEEIRTLDEPFGTLMLELPLREAGFLLPTWYELVALVEAGRGRAARIHIDGARLWEATSYLGQDLPTIAALADSVYVSFYKSLAGLAGAAIAGEAEVIAEARAWRHRYGGNIFQQWPSAVSALVGLDTVLPRLPSFVEHAAVVARALAELPGAVVHPNPPHTQQFQLWLPHAADRLNRACLEHAEQEGVWFATGFVDRPPTGLSVAEITVDEAALDWTPTDVTATADAILARLG